VTFHAPRLPKLSAPELRLPPVSVPDVDFEVPEFVAGPVKRLDELLSGPLVPKGARVMIADFSVAEGPNGDLLLGNALALALEAELATARHFSVVPRERALAATNGRRFALNSEEAAALAPGAKTGVLIAGQLTMEDDWHTLSLLVLDRAGAELYNVTIQTEASALMGALREGAEKLSQRLGETRRGKNRLPPQPLLSESLPALQAYAKARAHLHAGRYYQAISASRTAARHDSAFGAAYRLMADAYAMTGQRSRARNALDRAWQYRDGLSDRERLRLGADRKALSGRYSQAIIAYDQLFNRYRDDVGALKSQAILQRMIGARGRGNGNLRVAYSIDSVDWPPIARVARFLGYRGRIPAVESFASASGD
jgi:tetratricopeptide (TPR) repeat protein